MREFNDILRAEYIGDLWRRSAGLPEAETAQGRTYESLAQSEWSPLFESLMRARLILGALRYGPIGAKGKPAYRRVEAMNSWLDEYHRTGNLEFLVDVANLCLLEFVESRHPNKHFIALEKGEDERVKTG